MNNLTNEKHSELTPTEKAEQQLLWESNHARIGNFIMQNLLEQGTMPSKAAIAKMTALSRETVYRHFKTYTENYSQSQFENFDMMKEHVIAQILKAALKGDLNAAKLFLEASKTFNAQEEQRQFNLQNNYIQINKTTINQQVIQQLKPEQLNRIERLIAAELIKNRVDKG